MQIKFFKKEKKFEKEKENFWLNMNFYWKFAVCFIFIVILVAFFFGYYLFQKINKEVILLGNMDGLQTEKVQKERIEEVLEYFSLREKKSDQILNSSSSVIDPSL